MRVTFIGHASLLIETNGIRILTDPWWRGPCFGAQWWAYPRPALEAVEAGPVDYVYVSHGHHDHFHPTTLRTLPRGTRVLLAQGLELAAPVRALGFEPIEIGQDEERELGPGVRCRILRTDGDDSLLAVSDGRETCLDINDALHSSPRAVQLRFAELLRTHYPILDYVFCGYGVASHFPNCYVIPGKDRERTAANRQRHFNRVWAAIVHDLAPRFGFPFAADLVFLEEELAWSNAPTHNSERPTAVFRQAYASAPTTVIDIAPGFAIENGTIVADVRRQPLSPAAVREAFADSIRRVNRQEAGDSPEVDDLAKGLRDNVAVCEEYLAGFEGDYKCLIRFRNEARGIAVVKRGRAISVDVTPTGSGASADYAVVYTTRVPYLTRSLTSEWGHEILFVGSGGIFEYTDARDVPRNIHRELMLIMRRVTTSPAPRPRRTSAMRAKQVIKGLLGRAGKDLYDLDRWTVRVNQRS